MRGGNAPLAVFAISFHCSMFVLIDDLKTLEKLKLPPAWTFRYKELDEDLGIGAIDGVAHIVQDDLEGTYKLSSRRTGRRTAATSPKKSSELLPRTIV